MPNDNINTTTIDNTNMTCSYSLDASVPGNLFLEYGFEYKDSGEDIGNLTLENTLFVFPSA